MPTIEYNGRNPSAYGDMQRPGSPQSGPDWYDDRFDDSSGRTEVVASARVSNTAGTASGIAFMVIVDMDLDDDGRVVATGTRRTIPSGGSQDVGIRYGVTDNRKMNIAVRVIDAGTGSMLPGAERTFTVNSYEELREAALTSSGINITVN